MALTILSACIEQLSFRPQDRVKKGHQGLSQLTNWGLKKIPPSNLEYQQTHNPTIKTPNNQQRLLKHKQTLQTTASH